MFAILFKNELAILRELRENLWGSSGGIGRYHCIFMVLLLFYIIFYIFYIIINFIAYLSCKCVRKLSG